MSEGVGTAPERKRRRARSPSVGDGGSIRSPAPAPGPDLRRAVCLAFGTASALGFARFAYGLLMPAMGDDLGWTAAATGMPATANGLGYLLGALATPLLVSSLGATWVFRGGMVLTAATLAATGIGGHYLSLLILRAGAGAAGAAVFISGGVIASHLAVRAGSGTPITVYFAGTGLGIVLSGIGLPLAGGHWQAAWLGLGAAADTEDDVRSRQPELLEEHLRHRMVVVLPGVHQPLRHTRPGGQCGHHGRNLHEVGPGAHHVQHVARRLERHARGAPRAEMAA